MLYGSGRVLGNFQVTRAFQAKNILATGTLKGNLNTLDDGAGFAQFNNVVTINKVGGQLKLAGSSSNGGVWTDSSNQLYWGNWDNSVALKMDLITHKIYTPNITLDDGAGQIIIPNDKWYIAKDSSGSSHGLLKMDSSS